MEPVHLPAKSAVPIFSEITFTEALPIALLGLLERRYLSRFEASQWHIAPRPRDSARPLLREVLELGRPQHRDDWSAAMPFVLNACHEPGHAPLMVLHGQGD